MPDLSPWSISKDTCELLVLVLMLLVPKRPGLLRGIHLEKEACKLR